MNFDPYRDYFLATQEVERLGDALNEGKSFDPPKLRRLRAKVESAYDKAKRFEQLRASCPFASGQVELEDGCQPDPVLGF